ncbi:MAG: hypothetical protein WCC10_14480 [Tumebacillaceae bacterium]
MVTMAEALCAYAEELAHYQEKYTADDYYDLVSGIYDALRRHHGEEALAQMSDQTILKVIRSQVSELTRLKRIDKLMRKRDRI